jgi:D-alanyl-D-alanine carboxypeptidase
LSNRSNGIIGSLQGERFFYKEGGGGGFHCMMRLYPDERLGTVVMTNATGLAVASLLNVIDPMFFGLR